MSVLQTPTEPRPAASEVWRCGRCHEAIGVVYLGRLVEIVIKGGHVIKAYPPLERRCGACGYTNVREER